MVSSIYPGKTPWARVGQADPLQSSKGERKLRIDLTKFFENTSKSLKKSIRPSIYLLLYKMIKFKPFKKRKKSILKPVGAK